MSRRSRDDSAESAFGSDSFLDVVANIVGILIILIVIVGVRIKHAAPSAPSQDQQQIASKKEAWERERDEIEQANQQAKEKYERLLAQRQKDLADQKAAKEEHEAARRQQQQTELIHEQERRRREKIMAEYEAEASRLHAEMSDLSKKLQIARVTRSASEKAASDRLASLQTTLTHEAEREADLANMLKDSETSLASTKKDGADLLKQIEKLREKLAEVTRTMPPTKPLKHYATPMARMVRKNHVFFHCKGGRIAYAYFDELMDQARDNARGRMTPSSSRIEGTVGPIGAFRLKYVYVRTGVSMTEQLSGPMSVSYQAAQLVLKLDEEPVGETIDQAFEPNSSFRLRLRSLAADKHAITLWVYGDSFLLAKEVEEFCHDAGFDVVMMPLPDGHPVSLGPNGFSMDAR
jgi:multidrug efflux pump subunit AcrA (membrane-fusion protein)